MKKIPWFEYLRIERKGVDEWVLACRNVEVARVEGVGRKTWGECVKDDMKLLGLQTGWAVFRDVWRDFIHGANV